MEALRLRFGKWRGNKRSKSLSRTSTRNNTAASSRSASGTVIETNRRRRTTRHTRGKSKSFDQNKFVVPGDKAKKRQSIGDRPEKAVVTSKRTITMVEIIVPIRKSLDGKYTCNAPHQGRLVLQEKLRVHVDTLFDMLFSATSPFFQKFHETRNSTNLKLGEWRRSAGGKTERVITVTVALKGNVGPKTAKVTETQTLRDCTRPGQLYSIDATSVNAEIPYADAFFVAIHLCLRGTPEGHTQIVVLAEVKIVKPMWAVVQTFIEKNTFAGVEEFFQSLYSALIKDQRRTTMLAASGSTY